MGATGAVMNLFTEGRFVTETLFKQLTDFRFEHWEIKSRRPSPSIRVFGRFARPDVFIATHAKNRACLGGMWSEAFEREKLVCEEYWVKAGLPCTPPPGAFSDPPKFRYEAYITENATRKVEVPT